MPQTKHKTRTIQIIITQEEKEEEPRQVAWRIPLQEFLQWTNPDLVVGMIIKRLLAKLDKTPDPTPPNDPR